MTNEIAEITSQNLTLENVKKYICPLADDKEILFFANICKKFDLNPLPVFREVYLVKYGANPATILTGYETYLKRAERSGKYGGMKAFTEGSIEQKSLKGCVEVYRKDWEKPLYHEVLFEEYAQKKADGTLNRFWKEKPHTMIKKVAVSQAFRLAFPDEFSGMPYTHEEYNDIEVQESPKIPVAMPKSKAAEVASVEKAPENGTTAQAEGITKEQGMALLGAAAKTGWSKDDVKKYADTLGYAKLSEMNQWDYEDTLKYFTEHTKADFEKTKKEVDAND